MRTKITRALAVVAMMTLGSAVHATTVTAPDLANGNTANRLPFFDEDSRMQQVFESSLLSAFDGSEAISQISFRCDIIFCSAFTQSYSNITVQLSTVAAGEDGLSATLADNTGADVQTVFDAAATLSSAGAGLFDIVIDVADTFFYDSSAGNLLLDIDVTGGGAVDAGIFFDANELLGDGTSRAYLTSGGVNGTDTIGLVTRFQTAAAVPLPGAAWMLIVGVGGLAAMRRKRS